MMSFFTEDGLVVPATVIALESPTRVTAVKTTSSGDGYSAVQVAYKEVADRKVTKPELGHLQKAGVPAMRHLREFRLRTDEEAAAFAPGQAIDAASVFAAGDSVDVAGVSVGKGFQGTIKRYGFARGLMTHGSKSHREHGSTGPGTTPGRTFPGLKMAGRMGGERVKVRAATVLKVDGERGAIVVKGSVPGKPGTVLELAPAKIVGKNC
jgi:large subunit ribosomal protein L3